MADASWPTELPDWQMSPIQVEDVPNLVRSSMDVGPPKVRRRSTARTEIVRFGLWMNGDELAIFQTFFRDTLNDGALPFDWTRPDTEAAQEYRFRNAPQWSMEVPANAPGNRRWKATIELETTPV